MTHPEQGEEWLPTQGPAPPNPPTPAGLDSTQGPRAEAAEGQQAAGLRDSSWLPQLQVHTWRILPCLWMLQPSSGLLRSGQHSSSPFPKRVSPLPPTPTKPVSDDFIWDLNLCLSYSTQGHRNNRANLCSATAVPQMQCPDPAASSATQQEIPALIFHPSIKSTH